MARGALPASSFAARRSRWRGTGAREVVLAAGAIGSPQLLAAVRHRPGDVLQEHGIAVVHELPGVGGNLQDHLQLRAGVQGQRNAHD